jgi:hypothetical protein
MGDICSLAQAAAVDFDTDRVSLFQGMVRNMDASREAFIDETQACCVKHASEQEPETVGEPEATTGGDTAEEPF